MELQLHLNFLFHAYLTYVNTMVTVQYCGLIYVFYGSNFILFIIIWIFFKLFSVGLFAGYGKQNILVDFHFYWATYLNTFGWTLFPFEPFYLIRLDFQEKIITCL